MTRIYANEERTSIIVTESDQAIYRCTHDEDDFSTACCNAIADITQPHNPAINNHTLISEQFPDRQPPNPDPSRHLKPSRPDGDKPPLQPTQ